MSLILRETQIKTVIRHHVEAGTGPGLRPGLHRGHSAARRLLPRPQSQHSTQAQRTLWPPHSC